MKALTHFFAALVISSFTIPPADAQRHMMEPRVPEEQLAEARALRSPLADSEEAVEHGKGLYHGRGTCFTCHGPSGHGDGPAAMGLEPPPRNFHHRGFWRHRSEGEIFWVIKNGSPGSGMVGFGAVLTDEEIWSIIQYERSFAGDHGPRRGMGRRGEMGHMGPRGGMGRDDMDEDGPRGGMDQREEPCCEKESERAQ
jgi:mono/diheme cytochrome c family protein